MMTKQKLTKPQKWIIIGIPALFLLGAVFHFLYDFTGKISWIGIFSPVNESIWEHMKMSLFPVMGWWGIYFMIKNKEHQINKNVWFTSALLSLVVTLLTMPLVFYFYRGAFGIEGPSLFTLIFDIFILLLSVTCGQLSGFHFYKYSKGINFIFAIILILFIMVSFVIFTFFPPRLPIFYDTLNKNYGIFQHTL